MFLLHNVLSGGQVDFWKILVAFQEQIIPKCEKVIFWKILVAFHDQNFQKCQKVTFGSQPASGGSGWRAGWPAHLVK